MSMPRENQAGSIAAIGDSQCIAALQAGGVSIADSPDPSAAIVVLTPDSVEAAGDLARQALETSPEAVLLVAHERVEHATTMACRAARDVRVDASRVMGTGTVGHTKHLRSVVAERVQVSPSSVHIMVIGEAGPLALPLWSSAAVAGTPLHLFQPKGKRPITVRERSTMLQSVRENESAFDVETLVTICNAVVTDANLVLPVCSWHETFAEVDITPACFSAPTIVGRAGVVRSVEEMPLNPAESAGLAATSARLAASAGQ